MQDKIVINDYIENDPLSEENLDKTLETVYEICLLFPQKTIWLYTGYTWEDILPGTRLSWFQGEKSENIINECIFQNKRAEIIEKCDILVDGRYIDSQRDVTLKWKGSKNQRVIDIQQSLQRNKIILHCD